MFKITFKMQSPICFMDRPMFDAIISYCYAREILGSKFRESQHFEPEDLLSFEDMPIKMHPDGYFISTWMMWDPKKEVEYMGSWKKRWANEHDALASFDKKKRKVRISGGPFKSYSIPLTLHHIPEVWFYFDSDNIPELKRLIDKWLFGIGKKTSQGYGEFSDYEIVEAPFNFQTEKCRPIPIEEKDFLKLINEGEQNIEVRYTGFRPPYWMPENQTYCIV